MNLDQVPLYINFNDLVELAVDPDGDYLYLDCNISFKVDDVVHEAYSVNIAYRDLVFHTDKGQIQYLVDSHGDNHTAVLYNVELE